MPTMPSLTFDTTLGRCRVSWNATALTGVDLPRERGYAGPTDADLDADAAARVPAFVREAIAGMRAVLDGEPVDLRPIPLDEHGIDAFRRSVYLATRGIPAGSTRSYGEIAAAIGQPSAAREVGAALARNPFPIVVPCHRVVAANGALTGFSGPGGLATKRRMLELEGAPGYGQQALFD